MIQKKYLAQNFGQAAKTYQQYSFIQDLAADILLNYILIKNPKNILELGCGPGNFTKKLANKFSEAKVTAIDISKEMLEVAMLEVPKSDLNRFKFIQADAETFLADPEEKFDLIISNATLQWLNMVKQKGYFAVSMFGPKTFKELAEVLAEENIKIAAQYFKDLAAYQQIFAEGKETFIEKEYPSLLDLLKYIKNTGTKHHQKSLIKGLWTKKKVEKLESKYLARFGKIKVTYHLIFARGHSDRT
ncbi:MAG: methyltransferase domain-containing protein [bacterium]|nr:methyltransferase domain-containing protein [bacterium]